MLTHCPQFALFLLTALLPGFALAETETYLDRLNPVLHLHFDRAAGDDTTLGNGAQLERVGKGRGSAPALVDGPAPWAGKAWDFGSVEGPVACKVSEQHHAVGDITKTDGFSVSFWVRGEYSGKTSRIMTGPFDIGTSTTGLWGGSADYQNAATPRGIKVWDNKWHHVLVRVVFEAEKDNIDLWLDGERVGTKSAFYSRPINTAIGRQWYFGARNAADPGFDFGALADIAVFDCPLDDTEIAYIHAGPVFAGLDRRIFVPSDARLSAIAPEGEAAVWKQLEGPETVLKGAGKGSDLPLRLQKAGDYEFEISAAGMKSRVKIEALPNQPPIVQAGDGGMVDPTRPVATLNGSVSDNGIDQPAGLTLKWSLLDGPTGGAVKFAEADQTNTAATFSKPGLYTLQLAANDGELSATSQVSFLVGDTSPPSYLHLLNPLLLVDFEQPADANQIARPDAIGDTGWLVRDSDNGLPLSVPGARPHTGHGWDFGQSDAAIKVVNGIQLKAMHSKAHPARSISFWIKGEPGTTGYITSFSGIVGIDKSGAVFHAIHPLPSINSSSAKVTNGKWHHVALVIETDETAIRRQIYIDGERVAEQSDPTTSEWKPLSSPEIRHAQHIASRGRNGADNLSGALDDFALFNRALDEEEIAYIINGPGDKDQRWLLRVGSTDLDAGPNQFLPASGNKVVQLKGVTQWGAGLRPHWSLISGDGEVEFGTPESLKTTATFRPDHSTKSGLYTKFLLRLSLHDPLGREITSDDVTVLFYPERSPAPRQLTPTPPAGEHPRVLFSQADLPELRHKASSIPLAMRAVAAMRKRAEFLQNPNQRYGATCAALLAGRKGKVAEIGGDNSGGFFTAILEAAYLAWLGEDGQSDTARLAELAKVFAKAAAELAETYRPNYENALVHDVNWAVGLCYDLLAPQMDEGERTTSRELLAAMTAFRQSVGADSEPYDNSTNWKGFHDHFLMCLLAIEGEQGYDESVLDKTELKNSIFQTHYGIFESGLPHEGYAYYTFGMQWMGVANLAIARRRNRENLFATTRFYPSIETAFRLLDPDGSGIRSHHDVVEGPSGSGLLSLPPRHVLAAKYIWPEDRMVDYLYSALAANLLDGEDRSFDIFAAIWGEPVAFPEQSLAEAAGELDEVKFCPDRGVVLARDSWRENGIRLDYRCRMDKYKLGHQHADVNSFELWSHGREWIVDRGKFASVANDVASTVLIDGVGGPSAKRFAWPSFPGRFLHFSEDDAAVIGAGDAKPFYDYCFLKPPVNPGLPIKDHGLKWSNFYFERKGETMPEWMSRMPVDLDGYGNANGIYSLNPVNRAVRSVALARGEHPFVIVADDIEKDGKPRDYRWIANTPIGGRIVVASQTKTDLVLLHASDVDGGPRLLVRVLRADGQSGKIHLDREPVVVQKQKIEASRITIPCRTVAPNYRVLLYPFREGDPLPVTEWNEAQDQLQVEIGETRREVKFGKAQGTTTISSVE